MSDSINKLISSLNGDITVNAALKQRIFANPGPTCDITEQMSDFIVNDHERKRLRTKVDNLRNSFKIKKLGAMLKFLNLVAASNDATMMGPRDVTNVRQQSGTTTVRDVNDNKSSAEQPMEIDGGAQLAKLKSSETTLTGSAGGKLISETQLIRDCIFVM